MLDLDLAGPARDARQKVLASLPPAMAESARHISARIHVDAAGWYSQPEVPAALRMLKEAVLADRQVTFAYDSWKGAVHRTVNPLGLVLKAERWYLVASVGKTPRIYKVAGISDLTLLDRPTARPRGFDLASCWREQTEAFERQILAQLAHVWISAAGIRRLEALRNTRLPDARRPVEARPGWYAMVLPLEDSPHGVCDVLQLGPEIEVLTPSSLREAVRSAAAAIAELHTP